jgi:BirA family biotin operon repressor/biotin-[acetyl-CoA-carboxylase] ligase
MPPSGFERAERIELLVRRARHRDSLLMFRPEGLARILERRAVGIGAPIFWSKEAERLMVPARQFLHSLESRGISAPSGFVLMAGALSGARGRLDRRWEAEPGGIYMAVCFVPGLLSHRWNLYGPALGLSIAQIFREWGVDAEIRWLNDVLIGGKKAAGVLMEQVRLTGGSAPPGSPGSKEEWILAGIGINANQASFSKDLPWATSLLLETGRHFPEEALAADIIARIGLNIALLHHWESMLPDVVPDGHMEEGEVWPPGQEPPIITAYRRLCGFLGKRVIYGQDADRHPELTALARDILPDGSLALELDDGSTIKATTGEIRFF